MQGAMRAHIQLVEDTLSRLTQMPNIDTSLWVTEIDAQCPTVGKYVPGCLVRAACRRPWAKNARYPSPYVDTMAATLPLWWEQIVRALIKPTWKEDFRRSAGVMWPLAPRKMEAMALLVFHVSARNYLHTSIGVVMRFLAKLRRGWRSRLWT